MRKAQSMNFNVKNALDICLVNIYNKIFLPNYFHNSKGYI